MRNLFEPTSCLTVADLRRYVGQELDPEERFRIENHLLDCVLCSEALEGFQLAQQRSPVDLEQELNFIRTDLQSPTEESELAG